MKIILALILVSIIVSEFGMRHHELRRRLSFAPYMVYHNHQYYRFLTWPFIHVSRRHLYTNCAFLWFIAHYGHLSEASAGLMAFMTAGLSPIPRLLLHTDDPAYKATGISSIIAAYIYFYALREQIPLLSALVAVNAIYELVMVFFRPRGRILYDAHLIGAAVGLVCFICGIL